MIREIFHDFVAGLARTEDTMRKSKKIKRELHNFWLKQLDQREKNGVDRQKEQSPQEFSPLAEDLLFRRQLERLKTRRAVNPEEIDSERECFGHNSGAERFEGSFHVMAADLLSLQRAELDWNRSIDEIPASPRFSPEWQNIDDRLMWLGAPSL